MTPRIDPAALDDFGKRFAGRIIVPADPEYDEARTYERGKRWARDIRADLKPWASGAVYLNFIGDEGEDRVVAGFGRENYARLARVKAQYDPRNVFHLNHNIRPAR
jgi:FAD/FMN-containing dehydrogenase